MVFARGCLVLGWVVACKFTPPTVTSDGGPDAPADVPPDVADAPDLCTTWDAEHFEPCVVGSPQPAPELTAGSSPYTYNTTTSGGTLTDRLNAVIATSTVTVTQPDATMVALWNVASLDVPAGVVINVIGDKPLIIASWDTVALQGTIDAGSHTAEIDGTAGIDATVQLGAGASTAVCTTLVGTPGNEGVGTGGSGGGGGGGFGGVGAAGSLGDTGSGDVGGGAGGMTLVPTAIRAGCAGGISGAAGTGAVQAPATATSFANAGAGGGAIVVAARNSITVAATGRLLAGGGGGAGSPQGSACGGGGGGSGGYVGLDAPTITVIGLGVVAANGGGGGGSSGFANEGAQGSDGEASEQRAAGGAALPDPDCGERGGRGGAGPAGSAGGETNLVTDECGGGGGGGGTGHVLVWATTFSHPGVVSPDPQQP
ncbi:MAG: hypothetical protein WKG01_21800 [Kofleriaceae bacterium]